MKLNLIILSLFSIQITICQVLTDAENEERKAICGKGLKLKSPYSRKILNGVRTQIKNAPWNVALEVMSDPPGLCTGTIISPRHVITARHCFADLRNGHYQWIVGGGKVPGCDGNSNDIIVEHNFTEMFKLFAAVDCGYRKLCKEQKFTEIPIQKLILPEVCDDRQLDNDDFAIVELAENLKFNDRIKPICTAHDDWHLLEADVKMRLYGYGLNPANGKNAAGPLAYEDVFSKKCFSTMDKVFCIESLSGKQLACMGDSGGGVVRVIENRVTLIGILLQGVTCYPTTQNEQDYVANLAFYTNHICRHTGVCEGKPSHLQRKAFIQSKTTRKIDMEKVDVKVWKNCIQKLEGIDMWPVVLVLMFWGV